MGSAIMLCIATDNYLTKFSSFLFTHYQYCKKHEIKYQLITKNMPKIHPKWLKIWMAIKLLKNEDINHLILIDSDICIGQDSPNILKNISSKSIHLCRGISERPNSGLIVFNNDQHSKEFLANIFEDRANSVDESDFVTPEGENGHVIKYSKIFKEHIKILPNIWNNTVPERECFFKHYTNLMKSNFVHDAQQLKAKISDTSEYRLFIDEHC